MREINFNNAATSVVKPQIVIDKMVEYLNKNNFNSPSRGGGASINENRLEMGARLSLCRLFNIKKPENIVFTQNVTVALSMVINGIVDKGDHVITTSCEHNAVARPLELLKSRRVIDLTYIPGEPDSIFDPLNLEEYIRPNTKLMVMTHASNVTGDVLDYKKCCETLNPRGIYFVVDAAQTAGLIDIDFDNSGIDVLAFTGHKSLMGPTGIGGFAVKPKAAEAIKPVITGGTGSASHLLSQPEFLPDKFEPGTPNMLGIIGLGAATDFILDEGIDKIYAHEMALTERFISGVKDERVKIYGGNGMKTPVVSLNIKGIDNGILSEILETEYGISSRSGLHCSPLCHQTVGTYPEGALRLSFGYFNTFEEIDYALDCFRKILAGI